jgi:hypothetical protein
MVTSGRWTPPDAPWDLSSANRCASATNNPVNYVDPIGRISASGVLGAVGLTASPAGLAATALGAPLAAGAALSAIGTPADVGSSLAVSNKRGAGVAGVFGTVAAGFESVGHFFGVSRAAAGGAEPGYTSL